MYVYMYIFFFQGLEGIPWWSWFILAIVLLGKDRGGNILQIRKDISQFCKDIPQFSKRYSAIFAKIFRNFCKDIPQFSLNESRPGRRSVIYIYPVMNPNTFPS